MKPVDLDAPVGMPCRSDVGKGPAAWAWRYSSQIGVPGKQPGDKAQATISAASSANDATFTCTNTRVKDKWIDGGDRAHNVWSNGNVAKKED